MPTNNTGVISFNWNVDPDADFYKVKFYKNDTFSNLISTAYTSYDFSGVQEGDFVRGDLYSVKDGQVALTKTELTGQSFDVYNFHDIGKGLQFSGFNVNGIGQNFIIDSHSHYVSSGRYFEGQAIIDIDITNPRNDSSISYFTQEPFLTGIKSRSIYDLNDSITTFTAVDAFSMPAYNTGTGGRDFIFQIVADDYYGESITGNIYLTNQPVELTTVSILSETTGNQFENNISLFYSTTPTGLEYVVYHDSNFTGTFLTSGITNQTDNIDISIPTGVTGYLKMIPYDWFGSGLHYYHGEYLYSDAIEYDPDIMNNITNEIVELQEEFGVVQVRADYNNVNLTGSYFALSIDPDTSSKFTSNSYHTGLFDSLSTGFNFNYMNHYNSSEVFTVYDTKYQNFIFNLDLFKSGSSTLEASRQIEFAANTPSIIFSGINHDYLNGLTALNFITEPEYSFTGVDILFSGQYESAYRLYSGESFITGEIDYHADIKLVKADDHSLVFDSTFISGSGLTPSLEVEISPTIPVEAMAIIDVNLSADSPPVNAVNVYSKKAFLDTSTGVEGLSDNLNEFSEFNDYLNYFFNQSNTGPNTFHAPTGITANQTYTFESADTTGTYSSGSYFLYKFLPINGYGSGNVSDNVLVNYPANTFTESQNENISNIEDEVAALAGGGGSAGGSTVYCRTVDISQGVSSFSIDYSDANFTVAPHIVGSLSTSGPDDPILSFIISGEPTTGAATFFLSDTTDSDKYKLKYFASQLSE